MARTPQPRYREDRDYWFAQVDGKRVVLAHGKKNLPHAKRELIKRLASQQARRGESPDRLIGELCELRLDWVIRNQSPTTAKDVEWFLSQFTKRFGRMLASELKPHHIHTWLKERDGWSSMTQRHAITIIKAAFSWSAKAGLIPESPIRALERPSVKPRPLCSGETVLRQVLPWVRSAEFREYLTVLSATGARPSELSRLEASHLRSDTMTAVMEGKTTARTGRRRVIWFPGEAWSIVARRAKERPAGFLFQTEDGEPWSNYARSSQIKALRKRFEKARGRATDAEREKMTLPEFDSYSFRHGFVTDALERGLTSSEVAALVGNSSEMIDRVYDHLRKREPAMRAALERAKPERIQDTIKRAAKRKT